MKFSTFNVTGISIPVITICYNEVRQWSKGSYLEGQCYPYHHIIYTCKFGINDIVQVWNSF